MTSARKPIRATGLLLAITLLSVWLTDRSAGTGRLVAQGAGLPVSTFAGNPQHTAIYQTPAANLNAIRWSTPVDLNASSAYAHYGAPLVTAANTLIVPVKTATDGFRVRMLHGSDGTP